MSRLTSVKFIISFAIIVLLAVWGTWQYHNTTNADRVFWGMVDNNLQTNSVSRSSLQKDGGQSARQVTDVLTTSKQEVYSQTHFVQTGADEADATTENIGTPKKDYVRYTSVNTTQKNSQGKTYDFSSIVNVWGESMPQDDKETAGQLFNQSVLDVIPVGNLTSQQRHDLINLIKKEKTYSYTVTKTERNFLGRPTYTYTVTVNPKAYVTVLKQFAKQVGLNQFDNVNPDTYKNAPLQSFQVSVDGWSHQAVGVVQASGGKNETLSGRNFKKTVPTVPTQTISIDELQSRLQSIQ